MKIFRFIILITGLVFLLWFAAPLILFRVFNAGNCAGLVVSATVVAYGIFFEKVNVFVGSLWSGTVGKVLLSGAAVCALLAVCFVVWASVKIVGAANNPPMKDTTIVVLGCQVRDDGPSRMLRLRLEAALKYLQENENVVCILSGGKGEDEPVAEAECMYEWLVEKGIEPKRLVLEDRSTSTRENLAFSKTIIDENGLEPVVTIITNGFHQYRALQIAKALGIESYSISAKTPFSSIPTYYVREFGGVLFELVL